MVPWSCARGHSHVPVLLEAAPADIKKLIAPTADEEIICGKHLPQKNTHGKQCGVSDLFSDGGDNHKRNSWEQYKKQNIGG